MAENVVSKKSILMTYLEPQEIDYTNITFTTEGEYVVADGKDSYTVSVLIHDTKGNVMADIADGEVLIGSTESPTSTVVTPLGKGEDGSHQFSVTSSEPTTESFAARINDTFSETRLTLTFYEEDHIDLDLCVFETDKDTITANGEELAVVTVKLYLNKRNEEEPLRPAIIEDTVNIITMKDGVATEMLGVVELVNHEENVYTFHIKSELAGQESIHFEISRNS